MPWSANLCPAVTYNIDKGMSTSPPTTIGKYQIIREIARSNDIVYEGYDPLMNRRVAIKELAIPSSSTHQQVEDRIRRFQREVKAAGSLAHPNIVTIYEVGEDGGRHFMAMEFLDGHTLRNEMDTHGFLPPLRAIEIASAVLSALDFAHSNGVVHRDIKPDNIQLLLDGRIKLTDFGIARLTFEPNLTMDGQVFGTPSYMSPEQVIGKEIDARSDIFGVGVVLYEMIAGQKPFAGDNVIAITHAITNKHPDPPAQCGFSLWRTIERALDKTPAMRFASAKEMKAALEAIRQEIESGSMVATAPPPVVNPFAYLSQQNPNALPVYTQPYMPQPPPPQYAHNPYQAPVNYQPYNPSASGLPPVPVYYPPPPRRPMVSDETRSFLSKFFGTFLIVGLFFALVVYAIIAMTNVANENAKKNAKRPAIRRDSPPTFGPSAPRPQPSNRRNLPSLTAPPASQPEIIIDPARPRGDPIESSRSYASVEEAQAEGARFFAAGDYERAGLALVEAYEGRPEKAIGEQALICAENLVKEGPARYGPARAILMRLKNAGFDDYRLESLLNLVNPQ